MTSPWGRERAFPSSTGTRDWATLDDRRSNEREGNDGRSIDASIARARDGERDARATWGRDDGSYRTSRWVGARA